MGHGTLSPGTGLAELLEGKLRNFEDKRGGGRTDRSVTVSDVTFLSQSIWEIYRRLWILSVASPLSPYRLCCSADAPGQPVVFGAWFLPLLDPSTPVGQQQQVSSQSCSAWSCWVVLWLRAKLPCRSADADTDHRDLGAVVMCCSLPSLNPAALCW